MEAIRTMAAVPEQISTDVAPYEILQAVWRVHFAPTFPTFTNHKKQRLPESHGCCLLHSLFLLINIVQFSITRGFWSTRA